MPGRGQYWKKGGLNDGIVTEDDIDPAYQTTIEGGGGGGSGNWELVLDQDIPSNATSHSFNLTRSVAMDGTDVSKLVIIIQNIQTSLADQLTVMFNSESFGVGNGSTKGITSDGTTVSAYTDGSDIATGINVGTLDSFVKVELEGKMELQGNDGQGFIKTGGNLADGFATGRFVLNTSAFDPITSVQIASKGGTATINTPTRITAYAVTKN